MRLFLTFFRLSLACSEWIHARTVGPLVDFLDDTFLCSAEESVKLFVREVFVSATRLINGACAWLLAFSDSNYKQSLRRTWQQKEAWHSWWREERQSTLNAVLAVQCPAPSGASCLRHTDQLSAQQGKHGLKPATRASRQQHSAVHCSCSSCSSRVNLQDAALPARSNTAARGSSSWIARVLWRLQVSIIGRARASPAVEAAATGCSSNPLLQSSASVLSMPSMTISTSVDSSIDSTICSSAFSHRSTSSSSSSSSGVYDMTLTQEGLCPATSSNITDVIASASTVSNASHSSSAVQLQRQQWVHRASSSSIFVLGVLLWPLWKFWQLLWTVPLLPLLPIQLAWWTFRYMAKIFAGNTFLGGSTSTSNDDPYTAASPAAAVATSAAAVRGLGEKSRLRRSIVFEQPSGSAITHERARPRGLLEELCLGSELCVTAVFEATRWAVRLATLTWPKTYKQQQNKQLKRSVAAAGAWQRWRGRTAKTGSSSTRRVGWGGVSTTGPAAKDADQQQQNSNNSKLQQHPQQHLDHTNGSSVIDSNDAAQVAAAAAAALPSVTRRLQRSKSAGSDLADLQRGTARGASALPRLTLRRVRSVTRWDHDHDHSSSSSSGQASGSLSSESLADGVDDELSPAAQLILKAGYPLELHTVTTADGYILRMERIPRPGCARVAFFQHGILDTSLTWVSSGVTGSQAFAAWDQGFDVWLGSSRSNPSRATRDPNKQGLAYFNFSLNELGIYDMPAQLDHLHTVKMRELGGSSSMMPAAPAAGAAADWLLPSSKGRFMQYDMQQLDPLLAAAAAVQSAADPADPAAAAEAGGLGSGQASLHLNRQVSLKRSASDSELSRLGSQVLATGADEPPQSGAATAAAAAAGGGKGTGRRRGLLQRLLKVGFKSGRQPQQQEQAWQSAETSQQQQEQPQRQQQQVDTSMSHRQPGTKGVRGHSWQQQQQQQLRQLEAACSAQHSADPAALAVAAAAAADGRVGLSPLATPSVSSTTGSAIEDQCGAAAAAAEPVVIDSEALTAAAPTAASTLADSQEIPGPASPAAAAAAEPTISLQLSVALRGDCPEAETASVPTAGEGLSLLIPEVREPQTPDLAESTVRTEYPVSPLASSSDGAELAAAAAGAAAATKTEGVRCERGSSCCTCSSPFVAPEVQQAAVAALLGDSIVSVSSGSTDSCLISCHESPVAAAAGAVRDGLGSSHIKPAAAAAAVRVSSRRGSALHRSHSSESLLGLLNTGHAAAAAAHVGTQPRQRPLNGGLRDAAAAVARHNLQDLHASSSSDSTTSSSSSSANQTMRHSAAAASASSSKSAAAAAEPYDLRVVAHSLGGLSMLMYCVMRSAAGRPHHIKRLILMSPAGFHNRVPSPWWPIIRVLPYWHKFLEWTLGPERAYHPAMLPTYIARAFAFSYLLEIVRLPALADFSRAVMRAFFGGDASEWERALLMPHYSAQDMPSCSLHQALHFIQIIYSGKFCMFDYGSPAKNTAHYGTASPPDIGAQYWRLGNMPIDLMAGTYDGIIPPSNVRIHLDKMREQGLQVSYREFAYGHMDFTFSVKEELRYYVMKCLNRQC